MLTSARRKSASGSTVHSSAMKWRLQCRPSQFRSSWSREPATQRKSAFTPTPRLTPAVVTEMAGTEIADVRVKMEREDGRAE